MDGVHSALRVGGDANRRLADGAGMPGVQSSRGCSAGVDGVRGEPVAAGRGCQTVTAWWCFVRPHIGH